MEFSIKSKTRTERYDHMNYLNTSKKPNKAKSKSRPGPGPQGETAGDARAAAPGGGALDHAQPAGPALSWTRLLQRAACTADAGWRGAVAVAVWRCGGNRQLDIVSCQN